MENDYRIAFFTNTYLPFIGGVALSVDLYARYLRQLGASVCIYAPQYKKKIKETGCIKRIFSIPNFSDTDFRLPLPLAMTETMDFRKQNFDIVHVHHPFLLGEMGMHLARRYHLPLVYTFHTRYEKYTHYFPVDHDTAVKTIQRHTLEFCSLCDLVIAPSNAIKKYLDDHQINTQIQVLPTGIETKRFEKKDSLLLRKRWNIPSAFKVLIYVGRLAFEKNLRYLLEASFLVLEACKDCVFAISGEGESEEELREIVFKSRVRDRVIFTGTMRGDDLIHFYSMGDLFVFSSQTETQGMVVAESLASGTPVVALAGPGIDDVVKDGKNGVLVNCRASPKHFADQVLKLLNDPERLASFKKEAFNSVKHLDMNILAGSLLKRYKELKQLPAHHLKKETMAFGLVRNYLETLWEEFETWVGVGKE